ncbi:unnamed protein product [Lactuca saligna]|uniref:Uncharacterized protein n=1 Tax=Lactuca saligna TaxID=75948 RepID=A0AA35YYA2_LACSI|nr:unnamed protein product [Lactuca saligna]
MKIPSNNIWFNPLIKVYPDKLKMLIQVLNDSILTHALLTSFSISMKWLSLASLTDVYNRTTEIVTFQLIMNKRKRLTKKQFSHILKLSSDGEFNEVTSEQVVNMFNEMGNHPTLSVVSHFKKSNLPEVSPTNTILINYKAYMDPTSTGILPKKVTFKAVEGSSK